MPRLTRTYDSICWGQCSNFVRQMLGSIETNEGNTQTPLAGWKTLIGGIFVSFNVTWKRTPLIDTWVLCFFILCMYVYNCVCIITDRYRYR